MPPVGRYFRQGGLVRLIAPVVGGRNRCSIRYVRAAAAGVYARQGTVGLVAEPGPDAAGGVRDVLVIFCYTAAGDVGFDVVQRRQQRRRPSDIAGQAVFEANRCTSLNGEWAIEAIVRCTESQVHCNNGIGRVGVGNPGIVAGAQLGSIDLEHHAATVGPVRDYITTGWHRNDLGDGVVFLTGNDREGHDEDRRQKKKDFFHNGIGSV